MKSVPLSIVLLCIVGISSYYIGKQSVIVDVKEITDVKVRVDTVRDTIPLVKKQYVTKFDTIVVNELIVVNDTVYVTLPIERKEYQTNEYRAVVEGFKPALITLETYNTHTMERVTRLVPTKTRWGIGVNVGYGTDFKKITPYVGIGVTYTLIAW